MVKPGYVKLPTLCHEFMKMFFSISVLLESRIKYFQTVRTQKVLTGKRGSLQEMATIRQASASADWRPSFLFFVGQKRLFLVKNKHRVEEIKQMCLVENCTLIRHAESFGIINEVSTWQKALCKKT